MHRKQYHESKAAEHSIKSMHHVSKMMDHHEKASHDGQHNITATGEMATVKRVAGGKMIDGPETCGGKQGSKGLAGADPNS